jgi:hypothetical protein
MSTDYTLKLRKSYLHVQLPNDYEITPEGIQRQWTEIFDICKKNNYKRVLFEGKAPKRSIKTMDAFQTAADLAHSGLGLSVSFCFYDYTADDISRFFVNVAENRGAKVKFFSNKSEALRWLGVHSKKAN